MRRTVHDGYTNTYIVHKGKEKFKLNPLTCRDKDKILMCFGDDIPLHRQGNIHNETGWYMQHGYNQGLNRTEQDSPTNQRCLGLA